MCTARAPAGGEHLHCVLLYLHLNSYLDTVFLGFCPVQKCILHSMALIYELSEEQKEILNIIE